MKVREVLPVLESIAPARFAYPWDRIGLQVGSVDADISEGVVCLDLTRQEAENLQEGSFVVSHHPIIWDPLSRVIQDDHVGAVVSELIRKRCSLFAAHTNWDAAPGGVSDSLAHRLELKDIRPVGGGANVSLVKLTCLVPRSDVDRVIFAASEAGAGNLGNYSDCAFHADGIGLFRPNDAANPTIGSAGQLEQVEESRLEMIVPLDRMRSVEAAVRSAHPYEEPAYDFTLLQPRVEQPLARLGDLAQPMSLRDFRDKVEAKLHVRAQAAGNPDCLVKCIAVSGGSGGDDWQTALRAGADVLLTGEFKHNIIVEATSAGLAIIEAGHFATEQPGMENLCRLLTQQIPEIKWKLLSPEPGASGMTW